MRQTTIIGFVLAGLACLTPTTTAQRRVSDLELLVRTAVHEAGWQDTGDMEAIYAVLAAGAAREGIRFSSYARAYSSRLHAGDVSRRWAAELTEDCAAPPSWPRFAYQRRGEEVLVRPHPPWAHYRARCLEVVARARRVLAGELVHRCERTPHDWGGRLDRERAARLGLVPLVCEPGPDGPPRGDYYARPSLLRAESVAESATAEGAAAE